MIVVLQSVVFHLCCVFLFTVVYYTYRYEFFLPFNYSDKKNENITIFDCLYTSTTIQAGVGYLGMSAKTSLGKLLLIIHQLIMISANLFIFYFFTKHIIKY